MSINIVIVNRNVTKGLCISIYYQWLTCYLLYQNEMKKDDFEKAILYHGVSMKYN